MTTFRKASENRWNCLNFCKEKCPKKWAKIDVVKREEKEKDRDYHRSHKMLKKFLKNLVFPK